MKKLLSILLLALLIIACEPKGTAEIKLEGNESTLPAELKGLKVYKVQIEDNWIYVAILNDSINSLTYKSGKHNNSNIILHQ